MARDRTHIQLWRELANAQRRSLSAEVTGLKNRRSELEQQLRDRPQRTVERYVDQDELETAKAEADRAFRSRENAWQALCEVRLIHREGERGRCRCGQHLERCKVAMIVDRYPGLEKWENEQIRRLRSNRDHRLPDNHPAVLDANWRP